MRTLVAFPAGMLEVNVEEVILRLVVMVEVVRTCPQNGF